MAISGRIFDVTVEGISWRNTEKNQNNSITDFLDIIIFRLKALPQPKSSVMYLWQTFA